MLEICLNATWLEVVNEARDRRGKSDDDRWRAAEKDAMVGYFLHSGLVDERPTFFVLCGPRKLQQRRRNDF